MKKGQATVEFLLLIAILVPAFILVMSQINSKVFKPMGSLLEREMGAQVRYGYSPAEFGSSVNMDDIATIRGSGPVQYGPQGVAPPVHPLHRVKAGWE